MLAPQIPRAAAATPSMTPLEALALSCQFQFPAPTPKGAGHPDMASATAAASTPPSTPGFYLQPGPAAASHRVSAGSQGQLPPLAGPYHRPPGAHGSARPGPQPVASGILVALRQAASVRPRSTEPLPPKSRPCPTTTAPRVVPPPAGSRTPVAMQQSPIPSLHDQPIPHTTATGDSPPPALKGTSTRQSPASRDPRNSRAAPPAVNKQTAAAKPRKGAAKTVRGERLSTDAPVSFSRILRVPLAWSLHDCCSGCMVRKGSGIGTSAVASTPGVSIEVV